jgi:hypothetical protein
MQMEAIGFAKWGHPDKRLFGFRNRMYDSLAYDTEAE